MADKEWFHVPGKGDFPNLETASLVAEEYAAQTDGMVEVVRYTSSIVRCFKRTIMVEEQAAPALSPEA
ncbi:hypothetical protein ACWC0A_30590 [Streptomyces scopuliridis]